MSKGWKGRHFFLKTLLGGYIRGQYLEIAFIDHKVKPAKFRAFSFAATDKGLQEALDFIDEKIGKNRYEEFDKRARLDVYFGVLPRKEKGAKNKDAIRWGKALWVDIDGKDFPGGKRAILSHLQDKTRSFPPTFIVDTGNGYHVYWVLTKPTHDLDRLERINKGLVRLLHGDKGCWDRSRILRVPQTRNYKDLQKVKRVVCENYAPNFYSLDDFRAVEALNVEPAVQSKGLANPEYSRGNRDRLETIPVFDVSEFEDEIGERIWTMIIEPPSPEDDRSKMVMNVVLRLVDIGLTDEEIIGVLINPDYGISERPLEEVEKGRFHWITDTIDKARARVAWKKKQFGS